MTRPVIDLIQKIEEPNRTPALNLWDDLKKHLPTAWGSNKSHQAWDNGYEHHVQEVMNLAELLYPTMNNQRKLDFSLSSALLVLYLHDCEKPFRYASDDQLSKFTWIKERPEKSDKSFQRLLIETYGFKLSDEEWNGIKYVEGENEDYLEGRRTAGPLAAFCHMCDMASARIWFDYPEH